MNITVTYTNGTGRANRYLVAYDETCVVTLSGLTLTGTNWLYLTTTDGMHALANRAQIAANAATLNLSNTGIESLFGVRQTGRIPALLTVRNGSTGNIAGLASVEITPAADPNVDVVRVGIDYATTADIADLQNQIDALEVGALQTAASQVEAEAGTETAVRSWSPLRVWQGVAGYLASILTTAGTVLYRGTSGLAALTLRTTIRAAGVADDTSLATEAGMRTEIDGRLSLSLLTTAGDIIRATGAGAAERVPALTALAEAGAGAWSPALNANSTHTVIRSGIWTGITPSGLVPGEGCLIRITGAYAANTTGLTAAFDGALDDIAAAVVLLVIWRTGNTYYGACVEGA